MLFLTKGFHSINTQMKYLKKATNLLNLCRRNLHTCHENIKETAYKAIIRPRLEYASPSWNPYTSRNINKIEAVQRRAARFVLGNYNYSPTPGLTHDIHHRLVEKLSCSFFNPAISLYIYYDQYEKILRKKKKKFPQLFSMEMATIFDFRALTKVHLASKPLLQMQ